MEIENLPRAFIKMKADTLEFSIYCDYTVSIYV